MEFFIPYQTSSLLEEIDYRANMKAGFSEYRRNFL